MINPAIWENYANFSESEFRCKGIDCCGGRADMEDGFMARLQQVRQAYGRPMIITSGFRCADHNARVSSGRTGPHTTGRAADIKVSGENTYHLLGVAYAMDMSGIGLKQHGAHSGRFIHLDDLRSPWPRPRVWTY